MSTQPNSGSTFTVLAIALFLAGCDGADTTATDNAEITTGELQT